MMGSSKGYFTGEGFAPRMTLVLVVPLPWCYDGRTRAANAEVVRQTLACPRPRKTPILSSAIIHVISRSITAFWRPFGESRL